MEKLNFNILKNSIVAASNNLSINKTIVNDLNVFPVPDGDTGTNMNMTIKSALRVANESEADTIKSYMENYSKGSLLGARGNSGVILSQLIRGFVDGIPEDAEYLKIKDLTNSLLKSSEVAYNAVMKPTEGTILTVAKDIGKAAKKYPKNKNDIVEFMEYVYEEGTKSLNNTPNLLPVLKESGVVDAGGKGLICLFEGVLRYLKGDETILDDDAEKISDVIKTSSSELSDEDIKFGYCTEFIIQNDNIDISKAETDLRNYFSELGDSLLVIGGDGIIKTHVHTNNPGRALEKALEYGILSDIKIDNMRLQHNEILFSKEEYLKANNNADEKDVVTEEEYDNAFIAVSAGEGFNKIFESLNVAKIISGGQTMNPSTEDMLSAVEKVNAKNIFILPNNSNIILSAEQVVGLTSKNVYVIPTKSMPEGVTAIFSGLSGETPEEVLENSKEAISHMKTGEVTFAVRDTKLNGESIDEGDIIGVFDKDIVSKGNSVAEVSKKLIEKMYNDEFSLISIYFGEDTTLDDAEDLRDKLSEEYPNMDIEVTYGGQPLYYYIISIE